MKKLIVSILLAGVLISTSSFPVFATEVGTEAAVEEGTDETAEENAEEGTDEAEEEGTEEGTDEAAEGTEEGTDEAAEGTEEGTDEAAEGTEESTEETGYILPVSMGEMVEVDSIDLSLHSETVGDFTPVYAYENPFLGQNTAQGVVIEFYAKPTWEVNELGAIFAINGSGDYDGKLYFSPGSYLGFNSAAFGGYYDANLFNYTLVQDYIKDGAKIRIELKPDGFEVYSNDELCYDQTILDDPTRGSGDYNSQSDFTQVLTWLAGADILYFGYGSWWNGVGSNEANIDLSEISFRLADGTVLMDKLTADKALIESLGGSVAAEGEEGAVTDAEITEVDVELFDINSVEYNGTSVLPIMTVIVLVVAVLAVLITIVVTKKRTYDDI